MGSVDISQFTNFGHIIITLVLYAGAVGCVGAFALGIFKLIGRDMMSGVSYLVGAIIGGIVIGYALTWTQSLTGVAVG